MPTFDVYVKHAKTALRKQDYQKAIEYFTEAARLDLCHPEIAEVYFQRSLAKTRLGKYSEAIKDLGKAIKKKPSLLAYNNRAFLYNEIKEYEKAKADAQQALLIDPNLATAYNHLGSAYYGLQQFDNALNNFSLAIEQNPKYIKAYCNRGHIYSAQNKIDLAIADLEKAIEYHDDEDFKRQTSKKLHELKKLKSDLLEKDGNNKKRPRPDDEENSGSEKKPAIASGDGPQPQFPVTLRV